MTKERLQEIKDSIEFQMQIQQAVGYKSRYDDLLVEEIDLYNEVIDLQERIDKAIEYIEKNRMMIEDIEIMSDSEYVLEILKGDNK